LETLAELKERGSTVMIVAHRTGVLAMLDKLLVLRNGRVELYGPRDAVLQRLGGQPPAPVPNAGARARSLKFVAPKSDKAVAEPNIPAAENTGP
jgi:ATP-binding cassette subfamily C exporter for protease/lipase